MADLKTIIREYEKQFEDTFPTFCFMHLSPKEMVDIIERCLNAGKDVYEMGILTDDPDVKY